MSEASIWFGSLIVLITNFNKKKKFAGKDFFCSFMNQVPEPSLQYESTSLMWCVGFNKPQMELFLANFLF
jgi:hypothetical protein